MFIVPGAGEQFATTHDLIAIGDPQRRERDLTPVDPVRTHYRELLLLTMIDRVYLLLLITLLVTAAERRTGLMVPTVRPWNDTSSCVLPLIWVFSRASGHAEVKWFFSWRKLIQQSPIIHQQRKTEVNHKPDQLLLLWFMTVDTTIAVYLKNSPRSTQRIRNFSRVPRKKTVSFIGGCNFKDYRSRNSVLMSIKLRIVKASLN